jgi:hypothetical protein
MGMVMLTEYLVPPAGRFDRLVQYVSMTPQPLSYFIHRMILTVARFDDVVFGVMWPEAVNALSFLGAFDSAGLLVV